MYDYGYNIIVKAAVALGKGEKSIEETDKEYTRIMSGQDSETKAHHIFQQIAALSSIETHLMPSLGLQ